MNELNFIDTTLRDGQMSLWATGMRTEMILPVAATMDQAGFAAIEVVSIGFAKKMVRDLREDLWQRIDQVRQRIRTTPLRVIRGRHLASFQITPRSLDELWYERVAAHGIRQVRVSDSSNTVAGWRDQVGHARKVGIDPIVNLIFTISPRHTDEYYAAKARELAALDVHSICVKDPGGLLTPERTRTLLPAVLRNTGNIPVEFHTHCHTGLGPLCCLEAIKLGVRSIDTAVPPLADASSNPSLFNIVRNAHTLGYAAKIDVEALKEVEKHFTAIALREGLPIGAPAPYDCYQYIHQVPGGMISNLRHQLAVAGLADRMEEVLEETGKVRADFGYPIMVTPYSQFLGVQAVMNVVSGERYRQVSDEVIQFASGLWGEEESAAMDPNVRDKILNRSRARELAHRQPPQPSVPELRRTYGGAGISDEDLLLSYLAGEDQVAAMRHEGPIKRGAWQGLAGLIETLDSRTRLDYVHVKKGPRSLSIERRRNAL